PLQRVGCSLREQRRKKLVGGVDRGAKREVESQSAHNFAGVNEGKREVRVRVIEVVRCRHDVREAGIVFRGRAQPHWPSFPNGLDERKILSTSRVGECQLRVVRPSDGTDDLSYPPLVDEYEMPTGGLHGAQSTRQYRRR